MMKLKHKFVENIPGVLEDDTLYVSMTYATAIHKCCCGCGAEVVTPFSPTDWKLTFDGISISLHPSIGNWNFDCKSHYWIRNSNVTWAQRWDQGMINEGLKIDKNNKENFYKKSGYLNRVKNWFKSRFL